MTIDSVVTNNSKNFDVLISSLLIGFRKAKPIKDNEPNLIVFGATAESAAAFVSTQTRDTKLPANIMCVGANTPLDSFAGVTLDGYAVLLPELRFIDRRYVVHIAKALRGIFREPVRQGVTVGGGWKPYDRMLLSANREIDVTITGALFELFKDELRKDQVHVNQEHHNKFSRSKDSEFMLDSEPEMVGLPMCFDKVMSKLMPRSNPQQLTYHTVAPCQNTIELGSSFSRLDADTINQLLWMFGRCAGAKTSSSTCLRDIVIHDDVAKVLFLNDLQTSRQTSMYGYAEAGCAQERKEVPLGVIDLTVQSPKKTK